MEAEEKIMYNCNALPMASKNSELCSEWLKWSCKHVTVTQQYISKVSLRKTLGWKKNPKKKKHKQNPKNTNQNQKTKNQRILGLKPHKRISDPRLQIALKIQIKFSYSKG